MNMEHQLDLSTATTTTNDNINRNNTSTVQVSPRSETETPRSVGQNSPRQSFLRLNLGLIDRQKQLEKVHDLFSSSFNKISSSVEKGVESYQDNFRSNNAFKNWTKDEMVRRLVRDGVEVRDEANISDISLQNMMDEFYQHKKYPRKTKPIPPNYLDRVEKAVRIIQNAWISRKCKLRVALERNRQENIDDEEDNELYETSFGNVNWDNVGNLNTLYPNSPSRFETTMNDNAGFTALSVASSPVAAGMRSPGSPVPSMFPSPTVGLFSPLEEEDDFTSRASYVNTKVQKALDKKWTPPSWSGAKRTAALYHPSRGGKAFPYYGTTTGRHCSLGGCGEQCDMWKEGRVSQFAPYGPGITNYFKFIKWAFWVFLVAFFITLPTLVLNSQASSNSSHQLHGTDALAILSIGNLINYLSNTKTASSSSSSTFLLQLLQCDLGYGFDCILTPQVVSYLYVSTDLLLCIVLMAGYFWVQYFEKREEIEIDRPYVQISEFSIQVTNLPADCTSKELYTHFNKLLHNSYPIVDIELVSNNQDEIAQCLLRGRCIHERTQLVIRHRYLRHLIRLKYEKNKSTKETITSSVGTTGPAEAAVDVSTPSTPAARPVAATDTPSTATPTLTPPPSQETPSLTPVAGASDSATAAADKEIKELTKEFVSKCHDIDLEILKLEKVLSDFDGKRDVPHVAFIVFNETLGAQLAVDCSQARLADLMNKGGQQQRLELRGKRLQVCPAPEPNTIIWENLYVSGWRKAARRALHTALATLLVLVSAGMIFWTHAYVPSSSLYQSFTIAFTALVVSLCNLGIGYIVQYGAESEMYSDVSSREMSIFARSFVLKYINSGVPFLAVGSSSLSSYYQTIFSFAWYQTVGSMIVLVQIFDTCLPQFMPIFSYFRHLNNVSKTKEARKTILTQKELNKRLLGPEHHVSLRYSQILSTFFVAVTFNTGLPILNAIVFFNLVLFYFLEKYLFVRLYRAPEWRYTARLGNLVTSLLPYGVLIHLCMSIWTFTRVSAVLASPTISVSAAPWSTGVLQTASYQHTFPLYCLFFVIVLVLLAQYAYRLCYSSFTRTSDFLCKNESNWYEDVNHWNAYEKEYKAKYVQYSNKIGGGKGYRMITGGLTRAIQRNLLKGLVSYNMLKNPKYKELFALSSKFLSKHSHLRKIRFDKTDTFRGLDDGGYDKAKKRKSRHPGHSSTHSDSRHGASPPTYDIYARRRTSPVSSNSGNSPASSLHGANILTNSAIANNHANPLATRGGSRTSSNASSLPMRRYSNASACGDDNYGSPRSVGTDSTELTAALTASAGGSPRCHSAHSSSRTHAVVAPEDRPASQPAPAISATSAAAAQHTGANRSTTVRFSDENIKGSNRGSGEQPVMTINTNGNIIPYYPSVEAVMVEATMPPQQQHSSVINVQAMPM